MTVELENTFGALALALSDEINAAVQSDGLVQSEAVALGHLGHAPGLTITHLSDAIALSHAATVRLVTRLEAKGLVERAASLTDGRSVILQLSERGSKLHDGQMFQRQQKLRGALRALNADEQATLSNLSNRVLRELLRNEEHAFRVCRLCNRPVCESCPVETEMMEREATQS